MKFDEVKETFVKVNLEDIQVDEYFFEIKENCECTLIRKRKQKIEYGFCEPVYNNVYNTYYFDGCNLQCCYVDINESTVIKFYGEECYRFNYDALRKWILESGIEFSELEYLEESYVIPQTCLGLFGEKCIANEVYKIKNIIDKLSPSALVPIEKPYISKYLEFIRRVIANKYSTEEDLSLCNRLEAIISRNQEAQKMQEVHKNNSYVYKQKEELLFEKIYKIFCKKED